MRTLGEGLAAHLASEATTTCHCWRVTRRNGRVLGFTEHDRDLTFEGTTFLAASGFSASEADSQTGLAVSADEVSGGFASDAISEADLAAGRFDGARVELFLVNWAAPDQNVRLHVREIGEVVRAGGAFRAELRSLAHRLGQPQGRVYSRRCDASLGDGRCGVDIGAWQGEGGIVAIERDSIVTVSGLQGFADGFFDRGTLRLADGTVAEIETHRRLSDGTAQLRLWLPFETPVSASAAVTVTAGCDKTFSTCRARFDNHLNFRGYPHVPGADFAYSYADGERVHDGGPIFP